MTRIKFFSILVLVFLFSPSIASAAISNDTSNKGTAASASITLGGTANELTACGYTTGTSDTLSVTYNSVSMTKRVFKVASGRSVAIFTLDNPTTGTHTLAWSGGVNNWMWSSYIGASGIGQVGGVNNNGGAPFDIQGNGMATNSWMVSCLVASNASVAPTAQSGVTVRQNATSVFSALGDSNAAVGASTYDEVYTGDGNDSGTTWVEITAPAVVQNFGWGIVEWFGDWAL